MIQEKRNKRLLILLVVLTTITAFVYRRGDDSNSSPVDKTMFRVQDLKLVDEVALESDTGHIDLKYAGSRWMVNDHYPADRQLIELLFATLQQAQPKRAVATAMRDSLSQVLKKTGVKVSLLSEGKTLKSFYAGGNPQKTQAYFQLSSGSDPYVVTIPGYRVYTSGIFELDENGWREKRVFNFNWRNFKNLKVSNLAHPQQDFTVEFTGQYFGIQDLANVDTLKLNNYLDAVSLIQVLQYGTAGSGQRNRYDSLLATVPVMKIDVRDVADNVFSLSLYNVLPHDQRVLGKSGNEPVLFRRRDAGAIIKTRDYFKK